MPLKPCRECGRSISTTARACPWCGAERPDDASGARGAAVLIGAFGIAGVVAVVVAAALSNC